MSFRLSLFSAKTTTGEGLCVQAINIVDPGDNQKAMYPQLKTTQYIGKNKSLVYFDSMSYPGKKSFFFL